MIDETLRINATLACNLDSNILQAAWPLFNESKVDAIEWSFDALFKYKAIPIWFHELVAAFSDGKRLIGHGVYFSIFSGRWSEQHQLWLDRLRQLCTVYQFDHITEHFGFMTGLDFHQGAPMSIPFTPENLSLGQDRLMRLSDACKCPVGLENLAFAFTADHVKTHGEFLSKLIQPVNGFIILDLHNLYCQAQNFSISYEDLVSFYDLNSVREIHISGGSWEPFSDDPNIKIRRDTHDNRVPADVFKFLKATIPKCPNLKYVTLEQVSSGLTDETERKHFQADFEHMRSIISSSEEPDLARSNVFDPPKYHLLDVICESTALQEQQTQLSNILSDSTTLAEAKIHLASEPIKTAWQTATWPDHMVETALKIVQKWA